MNEAQPRSAFPERLREARLVAAMSQEELAKEIGCSNKAVSCWERGVQFPQPRLLRQVALITVRSVPWLLDKEESHGGQADSGRPDRQH